MLVLGFLLWGLRLVVRDEREGVLCVLYRLLDGKEGDFGDWEESWH